MEELVGGRKQVLSYTFTDKSTYFWPVVTLVVFFSLLAFVESKFMLDVIGKNFFQIFSWWWWI